MFNSFNEVPNAFLAVFVLDINIKSANVLNIANSLCVEEDFVLQLVLLLLRESNDLLFLLRRACHVVVNLKVVVRAVFISVFIVFSVICGVHLWIISFVV